MYSYILVLLIFNYCDGYDVTGNEEQIKKKLVNDVMSSMKNQPQHFPLKLNTYIKAHKIHIVDNDNRRMWMPCDIEVAWIDNRLTWDPKNYFGLEELSINSSEFSSVVQSIRYPQLDMTDVFGKVNYKNKIGEGRFLVYNIKYNGSISLRTSVTMEHQCRFIYADFPEYVLNCQFGLTAYESASLIQYDKELVFEADNVHPGIKRSRRPFVEGEEFQLFSENLLTLYFDDSNERKIDSKHLDLHTTHLMYYFQFKFRPRNHLIGSHSSSPLLIISLLLAVGACTPPYISLAFLLFSMLIQILFGGHLIELSPTNSMIPLTYFLAALMAIETVFILFWKLYLLYLHVNWKTSRATWDQFVDVAIMFLMAAQFFSLFYIIIIV